MQQRIRIKETVGKIEDEYSKNIRSEKVKGRVTATTSCINL
jgi:hypothetical protein